MDAGRLQVNMMSGMQHVLRPMVTDKGCEHQHKDQQQCSPVAQWHMHGHGSAYHGVQLSGYHVSASWHSKVCPNR